MKVWTVQLAQLGLVAQRGAHPPVKQVAHLPYAEGARPYEGVAAEEVCSGGGRSFLIWWPTAAPPASTLVAGRVRLTVHFGRPRVPWKVRAERCERRGVSRRCGCTWWCLCLPSETSLFTPGS